MGRKNSDEDYDDSEALIAADEIVQAMLDGTFVTDIGPVDVAHEVETIIKNFGIYKGADVAVQCAVLDQNDPVRVKGWKEVEDIIRAKALEQPQ